MWPLVSAAIIALVFLLLWMVRKRLRRDNTRRVRGRRIVAKEKISKLSPPNIPSDWKSAAAWRGWESPLSIVRAESSELERLAKFIGPLRPQGYLVPVSATLRREFSGTDGSRGPIRVEVEGKSVGYIEGEFSREFAATLDEAGCSSCTVAALIRGGSTADPSVNIYLWIDRRASLGPIRSLRSPAVYQIPWPPKEDEGR